MGAVVLPTALLVTLAALRVFTGSWRQAGAIGAVAVLLHGAAGMVLAFLPDGSWDGLAYHQTGVLHLASGWNPLREDAALYAATAPLYLNHYPKAPWMPAASVLLVTGHVEAGKLFNVTLMLAAGAYAAAVLLRLTPLRVGVVAGLGAVVALNPVMVAQAPTYYLDGEIAALVTVLVGALIVYAVRPGWRELGLALVAASLLMSYKFTGVAYAAVLFAFGVAVAGWAHGLAAARRLAGGAAIAAVLSLLVLGYEPYVRNTIETGSPFYPVSPSASGRSDHMLPWRPSNLTPQDRVTRFLASNFSRSEMVRPPQGTRLKFPFSVAAEERRGTYGADTEAGGFGPLFGASLLLAAVVALMLLADRRTRRLGTAALLVSAAIAASVFVQPETWWARFVPQAWLLPIAMAVAGLCAPRRPARQLAAAVLALAVASTAIVGANAAWGALRYARDVRASLAEMAASPAPVRVHLHVFDSLRRRLDEASIRYAVVADPATGAGERRAIPAPGNQVYWFADAAQATERVR